MKFLLVSLFSIALAGPVTGQPNTGRLDIILDKTSLQPGDSLMVAVDFVNGNSQSQIVSLATVELVIENENGQRTRLRWPMINGKASGTLRLPGSLTRGKYNLYAGLQQRFFEVVGVVKNEENIGTISAMLLTNKGDWDEQEISVGRNGSFTISNWLFEDNALLAFHRTKNDDRPMDIRISSQLDSSYQPLAVAGRVFYVGNPPSTASTDTAAMDNIPASLFDDKGDLLPAVVVKTTIKTPAQQFNEKYVNDLFNSADERVISILDQPSALGFPNILSYLQGRVAGLQINPGGSARWRGGPVTFFLDEVRTSAQQVASIPMPDIAIVKAYPPPFMGAAGGGGGIAIYTRRGGEANFLPANRQVFKVRGYTPASVAVDMGKMKL